MRLELRCCCDPRRLLGSLEVPDHLCERGRRVRFTIPAAVSGSPLLAPDYTPPTSVDLTVENYYEQAAAYEPPDGRLVIRITDHLAVKSDDHPIELLEQLVGFEPPPAV